MKNYIIFLSISLIVFGTYTWIEHSSASSTVHIVALGDSITHGSGDPTKRGYVERVKVKFEETTDSDVQVSNFAVPKYTTTHILSQLNDSTINKQLSKANYILLYVGTNDFRKSANYKFNPISTTGMEHGKKRYSRNLHRIINHIRGVNPAAPLLVIGLYHPYVHYDNHKEILQDIEQWNNEIKRTTHAFNHTFFVPTLDLFINKPKESYFSDSLHPNPSGYQLIAKRVLTKLMNLEKN